MTFLGLFMGNAHARARFDARCAYLYAPVLHFSLDGRVTLCCGAYDEDGEPPYPYPHLFLAADARDAERVGTQTLARLYILYGKRLRGYLPYPTAFAVYDARKGTILLGGTGGCKCYIERTEDGIWFSSLPYLLRAPVAVDLARLEAE